MGFAITGPSMAYRPAQARTPSSPRAWIDSLNSASASLAGSVLKVGFLQIFAFSINVFIPPSSSDGAFIVAGGARTKAEMLERVS